MSWERVKREERNDEAQDISESCGLFFSGCDVAQTTLQDAAEGHPDGSTMNQSQNSALSYGHDEGIIFKEDGLIPSIVKNPWNVVRLGRWVGVFVLLSAPVLAV
jgi:hypothetical protein